MGSLSAHDWSVGRLTVRVETFSLFEHRVSSLQRFAGLRLRPVILTVPMRGLVGGSRTMQPFASRQTRITMGRMRLQGIYLSAVIAAVLQLSCSGGDESESESESDAGGSGGVSGNGNG